MAEIKKSSEAKDYKERFEFRLTVGDNIICQRYFRINNFNVRATRSYELVDAIRECANTIDRDLKSKSQVYLEIFAPQMFKSKEEMNRCITSPHVQSGLREGNGIVVEGEKNDYVWNGTEAVELDSKFDDGELSRPLTDDDVVTYKLGFYVDGIETCSAIWDGIYPKFVRSSIDLSNKKGRVDEGEKDSLSFEQYLMYKMVEGRKDLVWGIIKTICSVCSMQNETDGEPNYTTEDEYSGKVYKNHLHPRFITQTESK